MTHLYSHLISCFPPFRQLCCRSRHTWKCTLENCKRRKLATNRYHRLPTQQYSWSLVRALPFTSPSGQCTVQIPCLSCFSSGPFYWISAWCFQQLSKTLLVLVCWPFSSKNTSRESACNVLKMAIPMTKWKMRIGNYFFLGGHKKCLPFSNNAGEIVIDIRFQTNITIGVIPVSCLVMTAFPLGKSELTPSTPHFHFWRTRSFRKWYVNTYPIFWIV